MYDAPGHVRNRQGWAMVMTELTENRLAIHLAELRQQHRDLDDRIAGLHREQLSDQLTLRRLKKQKLRLKDEIMRVENRLYPDIIA